ncbi:hypothetical protein NE237_022354 [Protea cynaroides]|uniref:Leucine-rich repeat-containing N-terminal plant-type domain-containing protein n=1 Tax=Protea cynaroides TaxID=273540 RepID=A0A9Q0HAT1_9MAGN|nr:hypothetical protein NE237_022354 [Protea cynaroides]
MIMASPSKKSRRGTTRSFILILCFSFISSSQLLSQACHDVDRSALLGFKAQITNDNGNLKTWNTSSTDCCTWDHINCDSTGRVIKLEIPGVFRGPVEVLDADGVPVPEKTSMNGTLSPTLGNLSSLQYLELSELQGLEGPIPPELGNLQQLTFLNLSGNRLNGSIPSSLGNLINLETLFLSDNQLSGVVPSSIPSLKKLTITYFSGNQLTGDIPPRIIVHEDN